MGTSAEREPDADPCLPRDVRPFRDYARGHLTALRDGYKNDTTTYAGVVFLKKTPVSPSLWRTPRGTSGHRETATVPDDTARRDGKVVEFSHRPGDESS